MIRIQLGIELNYEVDAHGADFVFNVEAAHTSHQIVSSEQIKLSQDVQPQFHTDPFTGSRIIRLCAKPGSLRVTYSAMVSLTHHHADPDTLIEVPTSNLPPEVMGYVYPSRYCESDRLLRLAAAQFGALPQGYARVQAICDWVTQQVAFASNTTNSNTSAVDTLVERVGVCRDFAHLMIALCRAVNIPARIATGTNYGTEAALSPPDFHAYVEVYLSHRWYIFEPSGTGIPMGFVRFGTGRDAADVAFATIFGGVSSQAPLIEATAIVDAMHGSVLPTMCADALSTDSAIRAAPRH